MRPVRYVFHGLNKDTGDPIEGRITAPDEDVASSVLGDQGIEDVSLRPETHPSGDGAAAAGAPLLSKALEDALADAGLRIGFDQLAHWYQGKSVWVLDRDKIRTRVMHLVDEALGHDEGRRDARDRIARVLEELFEDRSNQVAEPPVQIPVQPTDIEAQVSRLAGAVARMERAMASMSVAARRGGRDERRRMAPGPEARDRTHDEVLIEIFESNLELIRAVQDSVPLSSGGNRTNGE